MMSFSESIRDAADSKFGKIGGFDAERWKGGNIEMDRSVIL